MPNYEQTAGVMGAEEAVIPATDAYTATDGLQATDASVASSDGLTVSGAVGLLNIVIGLMLVAAFLLFFSGLMVYFTRLGLKSRDQGLGLMNWGVAVLFVLAILLGIMRYVQFHPQIIFFIVAIAVIGFGIWAFVQSSQASHESEDEK